MRDLERELRELAVALAVPATPDLATRVEAELPTAPVARPRRRRLVLAVAVGAAVVLGIAASPARTSILRFFGIGAVQIELVDRLPAVEPSAPLVVGREIDPGDAPFPVVRSDLLGPPNHVYASGDVVTLLYGSPAHVRLLVTEIASSELSPDFAKKLVGASTNIEFVRLAGVPEPGVWIEGEPHILVLPDAPPRLARNTLVWVQDGRTLRIEGALGRDDAVRIAESFAR
jgi:hypothetical protein